MKTVTALGDQAALVYFDDESSALAFARRVRAARPPWLIDVVLSYSSAAVFFDLQQTCFAAVADTLRGWDQRAPTPEPLATRHHRIPCCYELALDMARVEEYTRLSPEEIIALHAGQEYVVFAIGFSPGFPYLGYLPPKICNVPRLDKPRLQVAPGSVGVTGRQTAVYPQRIPGGWNIIGRTPLVLVDIEDGFFPLRTGDRLRFERIDRARFMQLEGQRLCLE